MLITENAIRRIIEEEIEKLVQEGQIDEVSWKDLKQRAKMAGLGAAGMISALGIHSGDSRAPEQAYDQQTISSTAADDTDKETPLSTQKRVKPHFSKSSSKTKSAEPKAVKKDTYVNPIKDIKYDIGIDNDMFKIVKDSKEIADFNKQRIHSLLNLNSQIINGVISRAYNESHGLGGVGRDGDVFMGSIRNRLRNRLKKDTDLRDILSAAVKQGKIDKNDLGIDVPIAK